MGIHEEKELGNAGQMDSSWPTTMTAHYFGFIVSGETGVITKNGRWPIFTSNPELPVLFAPAIASVRKDLKVAMGWQSKELAFAPSYTHEYHETLLHPRTFLVMVHGLSVPEL